MLQRMAVMLGFDEQHDPPTWDSVKLEADGPDLPTQSIWADRIVSILSHFVIRDGVEMFYSSIDLRD